MGTNRPVGTTTAQVQLRPLPASAATARRFVTRTLAEWGHDDAVDIAILLVSELVTNSILHARSDVDLVLTEEDGRLRVEVHDASASLPILRSQGPDGSGFPSEGGRGVFLLQHLAARWGSEPAEGGKRVWFELEL